MRLIYAFGILLSCLLCTKSVCGQSAETPAPKLITNARTILDLPADAADKGVKVRIKGVVTCSDTRSLLSFVEDETAGIYIYAAAPYPKLGEVVEVTGFTGKGLFSPIVVVESIKSLGTAPLPSAKPLAVEQLASGRYDSQWVEVEGVVLRQAEDWGHLHLTLGSGKSQMDVRILEGDFSNAPSWVDTRVKIRGVAGSAYNDRRQLTGFHLLSQSTNLVTVIEPAPADPYSTELRTSQNMMSYSRRGSSEHRMRLRGVVTFYWPGHEFFIRDEAGGVRVQSRDKTVVSPGDLIEVVGFPSPHGSRPMLIESIYRKAGTGAEPAPKQILAKDGVAPANEAEVVSIQAKVLQPAERHAGYTALVLEADQKVFRANYRDEWELGDDYLVGAIVSVTGVCARDLNRPAGDESFSIWMRRPDDFFIVKNAPAWRQRQMLLALGGIGSAVLLGGAWVILLRKRVQQQTAVVRRREAALDERYRDLFENANDIIYTHDLEGNFTSMNNSGLELLGYRLEELLRAKLSDVVDPGDLGKARERIKRKLDGAARTEYELRMRSKTGQQLVFEINSRLLLKDGTPIGVRGIARDITERKRQEEALRQSERQLRASLEERERLARDLHDGLIQSVYAIGLNVEDCSRIVSTEPDSVGRRLRKAVTDLNRVIREVRDYIMGLERHRLKGNEFKAAVKSLALSAGESQSAKIEISIDDVIASELSATEATQLLHIGREALTNAIRHSNAQKIALQLRRSGGSIVFEIADDGTGFNVGLGEGNGLGLRNMASRAREIGATFQVVSQQGEGTRIVLDMPCQSTEESPRENPFAHR